MTVFFFSSRRRHTRCALVTGVQTCALPIFLKSVPQQVRALALQHHETMDEKRRIGRAAAALIGDGETIILDSGSTTTEVAAALTGRRDMTVVTNALNIDRKSTRLNSSH